MSEKLNFKYGGSDKIASVEKDNGTIYAVNDSFNETPGNDKLGSIFRGDKILGTTRASELRTTRDIIVTEGSPIAAMGIFEDNIIPAGTSLEDFISKMVSKEIFPVTSTSNTGEDKFSVTLGAPTITPSIANKSVVEVGSTTTVSIKSGADSISKTAAKVSGFTYGYKSSLAGDKVDATEITADWTSTPSGSYSIEASASKFTGLTTTTASSENQADAAIGNQVLTVALGENVLNVSGTGKSYAAVRPAIASMFIVSNSDTVNEQHKSQEVAGVSKTYTDSNGASSSYTLYGVYPVYNNIKDGAFKETAVTRFGLTTGSSFTIENTPSELDADGNPSTPLMIEYPATKSVSKFEMKDPSGQWATVAGGYTVDADGEFDKVVNGVTYKYKRFKTDGSAGAGITYRITFNSGMNS